MVKTFTGMKKLNFADVVAFTLCLVPYLVWIMIQDSLPEKLPIHWNISGEVDGWTSKYKVLLFMLTMNVISMATYLLLRFIDRIDPKRTAQLNKAIALKVGLAIVAFSSAISILILIPKDGTFSVNSMAFGLTGVLFTFLGNLMYNIKPNYFIGIRLPWTLENDNNWKFTHRLAGVVWFAGGIICVITSLLIPPQPMFVVLLSVTALLVLIPSIYSFVLYRRSKDTEVS